MKKTLEILKEEKVVAIVRGIPSGRILDLARALYRGGIRCIEVTFDQSSQAGIDETARCIHLLAQKPDLCVGAGTVMNTDQVHLAKAAGARYIISPNVDADVIAETKKLEMVSIPGAFTPTETAYAYQCGADIVKIFPGGLLGPSYIKALRGPFSHIPMMAVGSVRANTCAEYIQAGCVGVGVGGNLVSLKLLEEGRFDEITAAAKAYMDALHPDRA